MQGVRRAALDALRQLDRTALAEHAAAIVSKLEHIDANVRRATLDALRQLDKGRPSQSTPPPLSQSSRTPTADVRRAALYLFTQLDGAALAEHATAIVSKLDARRCRRATSGTLLVEAARWGGPRRARHRRCLKTRRRRCGRATSST